VKRLRRWVLASLGCVGVAISCAPGFDPPSTVNGLRVLGIDADKPYANPGDTVTLRMTVTDGLRDAEGKPRPLQIAWIGGCFDPPGDQYILCLPQLIETFQSLGNGGTSEFLGLSIATPEQDGEPSAHAFSVELPTDIVSRRPVPAEGPHYGIAYVFFAACAGTLAPASFGNDEVPEFPLQCLDADGNPQGPESFVPGYTQIYAFGDGRTNANPPTTALTLDGAELPTDPADAPVIPHCDVTAEERRAASGCAKEDLLASCTEYKLAAVVPDVAESILESNGATGGALREAVWVSYFTDRGNLDSPIRLVSDATKGFQPEFEATWLPPSEPGLVSVWAVTRDQRGGQSVRRGWVRVE